jgi:hypothetical protein
MRGTRQTSPQAGIDGYGARNRKHISTRLMRLKSDIHDLVVGYCKLLLLLLHLVLHFERNRFLRLDGGYKLVRSCSRRTYDFQEVTV